MSQNEFGAPKPTDEERRQRARALASPLRMRILRLCLHEPRTNKELADLLGVNPGSMLHHVRALTEHGFLAAEEPRRGARGAREVPYRATGLSWHSGTAEMMPVLVETFLQEIEGVPPEDLALIRMGLKLTKHRQDELYQRMRELIVEYSLTPDAEGEFTSVFVAAHPDQQQHHQPR